MREGMKNNNPNNMKEFLNIFISNLFSPLPQKDIGQYSNHKKEIQTQESNVSRTDTYKKPGIIHGVSKQDLQQLLMSLYKSQTCL